MKVYFIQEARYVEYEGELYSPRIEYETYWGTARNGAIQHLVEYTR